MTNEWHEIAKTKGWHDNTERDAPAGLGLWLVRFLGRLIRLITARGKPTARQQLTWVALILTEWIEALDDAMGGNIWGIDPPSGKPCGLISELVDIWIRCMDTLGAMGYGEGHAKALAPKISDRVQDRIVYALGIAAEACRTGKTDYYVGALGAILKECEGRTTSQLGLVRSRGATDLPKDFDEALRAKTEYNKTRSYRHGGKLA